MDNDVEISPAPAMGQLGQRTLGIDQWLVLASPAAGSAVPQSFGKYLYVGLSVSEDYSMLGRNATQVFPFLRPHIVKRLYQAYRQRSKK